MIHRIGIPNPKPRKLTSLDIEVAVSRYFGVRKNIIVPNVWWGAGFNHELDLLVITPSGHGYEIEIKVSKADLVADKKKSHCHHSTRVRELYFAMPEYMKDCIEHVPEDAGVILVSEGGYCEKARNPKRNLSPYKFSDREVLKIAKLGTMRIWGLKATINSFRREREAVNG
jgi:hypothetical protein